MNRLKRSLSLRSSKRHIPESVRPHVWENDSYKVRNGGVSFPVKYVGTVEVTESRGTQVCAEAFRRMKEATHGKKKRMTLLVTADCIRVVDEQTKSLVIDQTIEKVSFCTPDPSNDRVFSYICREGTTRRWMCHCFLAIRDTGERLSHAVGCAFTACLQRKQKAQALQEQHKKQKEGGVSDGTTSASPVAAGGSQAQPQLSAAPEAQAPVPQPPAAVASAASSASIVNGPVTHTPSTPPSTPLQPVTQTPPAAESAKKSAGKPLLQPPPSVARPRPQAFNPSPFTRHTSLRYRSSPLSFMPLKDTGGYQTLMEELPLAPIPKLPAAVDALTEQSAPVKPPPTQAPVASSGFSSNQPGLLYNGVGSGHVAGPVNSGNTSIAQARMTPGVGASPLQPFCVQPAPPANQQNPWASPSQIQRRESEADKWLASAEATTTENGAQPSQGLLTTYNPFGEMSSQLDALSSAWTKDLIAQLPASTQQPRNGQANSANAVSSPWGPSTTGQVTKDDDEFSFLASRHVGTPGSPEKPDSNPFGPPSHGQVHWV